MADIQELIAEYAINEADLVAMTNKESVGDSSDDLSDVENKNFLLKNIEKALNMAKQLQQYILENDSLKERAEIFKRNLQNNVSPYQEIYNDLQNKSKQTSMDDFFKRIIGERMTESDSRSNSDFVLQGPPSNDFLNSAYFVSGNTYLMSDWTVLSFHRWMLYTLLYGSAHKN